MADMISVYDTISQGNTILIENKAPELLQKRYFPTNEPADVFDSADVLLDFDNGDLEAGAFVSKGYQDGNTTTYFAKVVEPPRIGISDGIDATKKDRVLLEQLSRPVGNVVPSHADALNALLRIKAMRLVKRGERSLAKMIVEVLTKNKIQFQHATSPTDPTLVTVDIDYTKDGANPQIYNPSKNWGEEGATPYEDVCGMVTKLMHNGGRAEDLLLAPKAWDLLRKDLDKNKIINNYTNQTDAYLKAEELHDAAVVGKISFGGIMLNVIIYNGAYRNSEGKMTPYLPDDFACVLSPNCGKTLCGSVNLPRPAAMVMQNDLSVEIKTGKFVVSRYYDFNEQTVKVRVESNPLPCPAHIWGWITLGKQVEADVSGLSNASVTQPDISGGSIGLGQQEVIVKANEGFTFAGGTAPTIDGEPMERVSDTEYKLTIIVEEPIAVAGAGVSE